MLDYSNLIQNTDDFIIASCDKNLGPAIIEKTRYIQLAFRDHLNDSTTYRYLSTADADQFLTRLKAQYHAWFKTYSDTKDLTRADKRYLKHMFQNSDTPFPVLYLTLKIHKQPMKTRPIVSCSGSLLYGLGVWLDHKLQQVASQQKSYFKSSFDLKRELTTLRLPPNARLFTADAVSMYTNIPTAYALHEIAFYLRSRRRQFDHLPIDAIIDALRLLMTNSAFTFGDTTWKQKRGSAMGIPPVPPYANLYSAIHEDPIIDSFDEIELWQRFIDDGLGIWFLHPNPTENAARWDAFKTRMNTDFGGLQWEFSELSTTIDFMDLTLTIRDSRIHTTLYEKASNLHLYIPPHSAYPPGVLSGLIMGNVYRFHNLCTDATDVQQKTLQFFQRLAARGHNRDVLRPIFSQAIVRVKKLQPAPDPDEPTQPRLADNNRIFFHLTYHPEDPPAREIQRRWREHIAAPSRSTPLPFLRNHHDFRIHLNRMIVCYHRPPNLGNLLSYRQIEDRNGPPVSSFWITDSGGPSGPQVFPEHPTQPTAPPRPDDSTTAPVRAVAPVLYSIFRR